MPQIRPYRTGDEPALSSICVRTGDGGDDATGVLDDDSLWGNLFVLPYLEHDPELAFVVESDAGAPRGYLVGTADSNAFAAWFRTSWWPRFSARWPEPAPDPPAEFSQERNLLRYAYGMRRRARTPTPPPPPRTCTSTCSRRRRARATAAS